jgi:hypothetical protein|tara:strand:- start:470 stop:661 length:192 start_codon:yes stop_codon:yes gene_type:complete
MNKIILDWYDQKQYLGEILNDLQYNGFRYEVTFEDHPSTHQFQIVIAIKGIVKQGKENPRYVV